MKKILRISFIIVFIAVMAVFSACSNIGSIKDSACTQDPLPESDSLLPDKEIPKIENSDGQASEEAPEKSDSNSGSSDKTDGVLQSPSKTESSDQNSEQSSNYELYLQSAVNVLTVRSAPSASAEKLGSLNKGDMVSFRGKTGNWYITVYREQTAYVYASYIQTVKITTSTDAIEKSLDVGEALLGYPYVYGSQRYHWGNGILNTNFTAGEFDCSALTQYMFFKGCGALLEVTSRLQYSQGTKVDQPMRGDLMFFTNAYGQNLNGINRIRHVGVYLGNNYILHTASDHAVIEEISAQRWSYFIAAKRILD